MLEVHNDDGGGDEEDADVDAGAGSRGYDSCATESVVEEASYRLAQTPAPLLGQSPRFDRPPLEPSAAVLVAAAMTQVHYWHDFRFVPDSEMPEPLLAYDLPSEQVFGCRSAER